MTDVRESLPYQAPWLGKLLQLAEKNEVDVITPVDARYETVRLVYNRFHDLYPAALVMTKNTTALATILRFAADENAPLAIRGGGHHIAGFGSSNGGIVLDFSPFREVVLNSADPIVRVEPGARLGDVDRKLTSHGLVIPTGTVSDTGIAGLTLGGGIGWLVGRFGLTCDQLVGADVVLADGRLVKAEQPDHAHLLWALKGGGGNFGVVTEFRYKPNALPPMIAGSGIVGVENAGDSLERLVHFLQSCPRYLTVAPILYRNSQGTPTLSIDFCLAGRDDRTLNSLIDAVGPASWDIERNTNYPAWQSAFDHLFQPPMRGYWKSRYSTSLTRADIDILIDAFTQSCVSRSAILIEHLHGAFADFGIETSSFPLRWAHFGVLLSARWEDACQDDMAIRWVRETFARLDPTGSSAAYSNYTALDDARAVESFSAGIITKLAKVKDHYDPANLFQRNHNVRPSSISNANVDH